MSKKSSLYLGLLLVGIGLIFLVAQTTQGMRVLGMRLGWRGFWPLLICYVGLAFWLAIAVWWNDRQRIAGMAVPGTIILLNGVMLLYQNATRNWSSWAYSWALEPVFVGLGLLALWVLSEPRPRGLLVAAGIVAGIGAVFFLVFATAFGGVLVGILVPFIIIAAGVLILLRGIWQRRDDDPAPVAEMTEE